MEGNAEMRMVWAYSFFVFCLVVVVVGGVRGGWGGVGGWGGGWGRNRSTDLGIKLMCWDQGPVPHKLSLWLWANVNGQRVHWQG